MQNKREDWIRRLYDLNQSALKQYADPNRGIYVGLVGNKPDTVAIARYWSDEGYVAIWRGNGHPDDPLDFLVRLTSKGINYVENLLRKPSVLPARLANQGTSHPTMSNMSRAEPEQVDIAIITIIDEEHDAIRSFLDDLNLAKEKNGQPNLYSWEYGIIKSPRYEQPYTVALAFAGGAGNISGTLVTLKTISRWQPRYVIVLGVAGGLPINKLNLGDIVVSSLIHGYEYGKIEEKFTPRADQTFRTDAPLCRNAITFSRRTTVWKDHINISPPKRGTDPKVLKGPIASGDKVIDNVGSEFFKAVITAWPKLQAVEMEGAGAAAAVESAQEEGVSVQFLMVRGISDMPPSEPAPKRGRSSQTKQRDAWKKYASATAASFLVHYIKGAWPVQPRNPS